MPEAREWIQVSGWEDKKVLEMDGGNDWETMWTYLLMPRNYILKNGKFCYICFTTIKKILSGATPSFYRRGNRLKDITQLVQVHIATQ